MVIRTPNPHACLFADLADTIVYSQKCTVFAKDWAGYYKGGDMQTVHNTAHKYP